jgi:hypothetical protein
VTTADEYLRRSPGATPPAVNDPDQQQISFNPTPPPPKIILATRPLAPALHPAPMN